MTAANAFKRLGYGIGAVVAATIAAFAVVSFFIPADTVREAIKSEIRIVTGLDPVMRGDVSVSLFPYGSVSFADVVLGDDRAGEPALAAERLTAQLKFLPLLAGRFEISGISLVRPRIALTLEPGGRSNWSGLVETLARTIKPDAKKSETLLSFSEMRITKGTLVVRDAARNVNETVSDIEMSLAWPSISKSFGATGSFVWHGETVDASFSLADLFAALSGARSGVKVRINAPPLKAAFDGYLSNRPTLKVEGTLAADSTSLRQAQQWIGQEPLPGGGFGRFALKAQTNMVGGTVALSNVNVELDGNAAEGVLTFTTDGRTVVQGTLAADALDLTPYVSTVRLLTANERDWNTVPIALDGLTGFDVDLRLSAAKISLSGAKLGRTAIAANLRGGQLTIAIGESQAFGGIVQGSVGLAKSPSGAALKAQLQFANVDLETCLAELIGIRKVEGKGNLTFTIDGSGVSVLDLTRTLNGTANLTARKGAIAGLNVEQLLRRLERRPLSGSGDFRTGRTPFESLTVALKIAQGTARIENVALEGAAVRLKLDGTSSIPARKLDLKGTASLISTNPNEPPGFDLPFVVQGSWDDPVMLPDPQALIRRSPSAAPLLDSLKDRQTRDSVRSVIEQLTRGTPAPAGTAAKPETPASR